MKEPARNAAKRKTPDRSRGRREGKGLFCEENPGRLDSPTRCHRKRGLQVLGKVFSEISLQPGQPSQTIGRTAKNVNRNVIRRLGLRRCPGRTHGGEASAWLGLRILQTRKRGPRSGGFGASLCRLQVMPDQNFAQSPCACRLEAYSGPPVGRLARGARRARGTPRWTLRGRDDWSQPQRDH